MSYLPCHFPVMSHNHFIRKVQGRTWPDKVYWHTGQGLMLDPLMCVQLRFHILKHIVLSSFMTVMDFICLIVKHVDAIDDAS